LVAKWQVLIHPGVNVEVAEASKQYEDAAPNLGGSFRHAVANATRQLQGFPKAYREYMRGWRRVVLPRFPYLMIYQVRGKSVYVATVQHAHGNPVTIKKTIRSRPISSGEYQPLRNPSNT